MELTNNIIDLIQSAVLKLNGSESRKYKANVVRKLGKGGQRKAEKILGWYRGTIRKGEYELKTGKDIIDRYNDRGRKKAEEILPNLLSDIKDIIDSQSQIDSTFKTTQLYTRITTVKVRELLIKNKNYKDEELPKERCIRNKINDLGYKLRKVQKSRPLKKNKRNRCNL